MVRLNMRVVDQLHWFMSQRVVRFLNQEEQTAQKAQVANVSYGWCPGRIKAAGNTRDRPQMLETRGGGMPNKVVQQLRDNALRMRVIFSLWAAVRRHWSPERVMHAQSVVLILSIGAWLAPQALAILDDDPFAGASNARQSFTPHELGGSQSRQSKERPPSSECRPPVCGYQRFMDNVRSPQKNRCRSS